MEIRATLAYVERAIPLDILKSMTIIDSPGLNSLQSAHEETTRAFMDQADTVIWLSDAQHPCSQTEMNALKRLNPRFNPLVLINKMDKVDEEGDGIETPESILADFDRKLRNNRLEVQGIIGISAKLAFQGTQQNNDSLVNESNIGEFYEKVDTQVLPHREEYKRNSLFDGLARVVFSVETFLSHRKEKNAANIDADYATYIENETTFALIIDCLENIADDFLEILGLSRENLSNRQVDKLKLNPAERTLFGVLYWFGRGVDQSTSLAEKHLEAAAVRRDEGAQYILAHLYLGMGDLPKAKYWAKTMNNGDAEGIRKKIYIEEIKAGKKDVFTETLTVMEPGNAFIGTIKISGEDALGEDEMTCILPICKEVLDFLMPDEIARNLTMEVLPDEIQFTFFISDQGSTTDVSFVHTYPKNDLIYLQTNVPVIEIFPNARIEGMGEYYLYYENTEAQNKSNQGIGRDYFYVRPWYQKKGIPGCVPDEGLRNRYVAKLPDFPDVLLCSINISTGATSQKVIYAGMVLLQKPETIKTNSDKKAMVRLSFDDDIQPSETEEYGIPPLGGVLLQRKVEKDSWAPFPLYPNLFQVTDSGVLRTRTFNNFIPSYMGEGESLMPTIFHIFHPENFSSAVSPFLDGNIWHIWRRSELMDRNPEMFIQCFTDTAKNSMAFQCTIAYIKQLALQILVQLVKQGVFQFSYEILFPSQYTKHQQEVFMDICNRELDDVRKRLSQICGILEDEI